MTTTASSTPCWKSALFERLRRGLLLLLWILAIPVAQAQTAELQQVQADRVGTEVRVSAVVQLELPAVVEEALQKGIPLFFVWESDLLQERWYWYGKRMASVQRQLRLAYQPLTRRWRVSGTAVAVSDGAPAVSVSQNFDTLAEAMATIKRVSRWKVGELGESESNAKYRVELRFRLDLGQLPRPFQIGTIGQSEWDIQTSARVLLRAEASK